MESRGTGSVSVEGLVPLRMDIGRRWKEAEEENPDPWLAGKGVQIWVLCSLKDLEGQTPSVQKRKQLQRISPVA